MEILWSHIWILLLCYKAEECYEQGATAPMNTEQIKSSLNTEGAAMLYWICLMIGVFMWTIGELTTASHLRQISRDVEETESSGGGGPGADRMCGNGARDRSQAQRLQPTADNMRRQSRHSCESRKMYRQHIPRASRCLHAHSPLTPMSNGCCSGRCGAPTGA